MRKPFGVRSRRLRFGLPARGEPLELTPNSPKRSLRLRTPKVRATLAALLCLAALSCGKREEPKPQPTPLPSATLGSPRPTRTLGIFGGESTVTPVNTPSKKEALPREIGGVSLGMDRLAVIEKIGALTCHDNPQGIEVCTGERQPATSVKGFEIYMYREKVLSLAYEEAANGDAWTYLDGLLRRFGEPTLKGLADRDRQDRLHEVYGWRDDDTLYSARFIWEEIAPNPRKLVGTAVAIWDRKAYEAWEKDPERRKKVTPYVAPPQPPELPQPKPIVPQQPHADLT